MQAGRQNSPSRLNAAISSSKSQLATHAQQLRQVVSQLPTATLPQPTPVKLRVQRLGSTPPKYTNSNTSTAYNTPSSSSLSPDVGRSGQESPQKWKYNVHKVVEQYEAAVGRVLQAYDQKVGYLDGCFRESAQNQNQKSSIVQSLQKQLQTANSLITSKQSQLAQKSKLIAHNQQQIQNLQIDLKLLTKQCEAHRLTIDELKEANRSHRQTVTELNLHNKSLKAENKILTTHLDNLIRGNLNTPQTPPQQILDSKQQVYIRELSRKINSTEKQLIPSDRNELTNKLKLEQQTQEYQQYQVQMQGLVDRLQGVIADQQQQIQQQARNMSKLDLRLCKLNQLRDTQRESLGRMQQLIIGYEKHIAELNQHNQNISAELTRLYAEQKRAKAGFITSHKYDLCTR